MSAIDTGSRLSSVAPALNDAIADGAISASELRDLKNMATNGTVALVDINATLVDAERSDLDPELRGQVTAALQEMRTIASQAAGAKSDGLFRALQWYDGTLGAPFALVAKALGMRDEWPGMGLYSGR